MYFKVEENGIMKFRDIVWVPDLLELKKIILEESHMISSSIHLVAMKMYQDIKNMF